MWLLTENLPLKLKGIESSPLPGNISSCLNAMRHLSLLKVSLPINVGRLDVADATGVAGPEEKHVRRDDIVGSQFDKVADADFLPLIGQEDS